MNRGIRFFTGTKRKKAGFSLSEVLVVIVILGILAAVGGVSAVSMYKNMKQTQLDKTAETIFHAVQDRLSELYAYGKEDTIDKDHGGTQVDGYADKKVFYIKSGVSSEANTAIMGDDTVNGEIFANYWVIEYQASTCRVLNVVYADRNDSGLGGFGRGINEGITITTLENAIKNHAFSLADRKDKFGWYGETDILPLLSENKQVGNTSVDVDIVNEENLYAHVRVSVGWEDSLTATEIPDFLKNVTIKLTLKDADTGAEYGYPSITADKLLSGPGLNETSVGFYHGKSDADGGATDYISAKYISASWDVLLDSLYNDAFDLGSKRRYVPTVTPGHDFYLIAKLEGADGITPTVQDYDIDNSLFAAASGTKAYVEYGRHLQNVGKAEVNGLNAIQIADINFNAKAPDGVTSDNDLDKFNKFWLSVYDDVGGFTNFKPTDSSYLASYDGQNHLIKNLDINQVNGTSDSGIFGTLSYADAVVNVKNVIITDSTISSTSGAGKAGMFVANVTASNGVTLENCYLNKVTIDGSNTASLGGFIGEATCDVKAENCSFAAVKVGTDVSPAVSGSFIGKISAGLKGKNLSVLGGSVRATSNSGGIIGSSDADSKDITLKGCKVFGTEVAASNGNAGGIAGNVINAQITINEDTAVASGIVRSSNGNAGGFIGNADAVINIKDSEYFIPSSSESDKDACSVKTEFVKTMGLTADTPNAVLKYAHLKDKFDFKYIEDLKSDDIVNKKTIVGYGNVGGLVGASTKNITIENTFSAGVLSAATNAGGFVGSTTGKLTVNSSYSDFYISGKNVGGFAAACNSSSEFHSCYTAGFLTSTADTAAGFAPVEIGDVSDSYSVFNFDNVCGFAGKAGQDSDHNVNVNGTVNNYPDVNAHNNCYPIAPKSKGVAYYVYTATTFTESANAVAVTSTELAENTKTGGGTLLGGNFVTGTDSGSTYPYLLSSFLDTTLVDYPFPKLSVSKVTVTDSSPTENVKLGHYNDWLTLDGKNDIEIWYIMYDENLNNLKTDVPGIGRTGMKLARRTKAIPVTLQSGASEYQINVGKHTTFSGYKFVGYYDPDTATKVGTTTFDRAKKLDYLDKNDTDLSQSIKTTMKSGDRVVQTSINTTNTFGEACGTHSAILRAGSDGTKRLYAVYRYNKPYTVTLSYVEYELPAKNATKEDKTLEKIYTGSKKVASMDKFQVTYSEPADGYTTIYKNDSVVREKVKALHESGKLSHDEEFTEDYIAEAILQGDTAALTELDGKRAAANQTITRKIPSFSQTGFELLDFQALYNHVPRIITQQYLNYVTNTMPVFPIVKLGPATDSYDNPIAFDKRERTQVTKNNNNEISLSTHKAFDYVILYYSDSVNRKLNLVFRNTTPNGNESIPEVGKYGELKDFIANRAVSRNSSDAYTVTVSRDGFEDTQETLVELMNPNNAPKFVGFTLNSHDSVYPSGSSYEATLYYDRNTYSLSFALNNNAENPVEKYKTSQKRDPINNLYYGELYHKYLWETTSSSTSLPNITGPNMNQLRRANNIEVGYWKTVWYIFWTDYEWVCTDQIGTYAELEQYIMKLEGTTGTLELKYGNNDDSYTYRWTKEEATITYAFNRTGYLLSGFIVYHQTASGEYKEYTRVKTIADILAMPDANVKVEPEWMINPSKLRIEVYYQSAYDDIQATNKTKSYEFGAVANFNLTDGRATDVTRRVNNRTDTMTVNNIVQSEISSDKNAYAEYLDSFLKADNSKINKKKEHNPNAEYPYVLNSENTLNKGYHHFIDNETMVVALYYDRAKVNYTFHFINNDNYTFDSGWNTYSISNQWSGIVNAADSAYNYTGSDQGKINLRDELRNKTGNPVKAGKHAEVSCFTENVERVSGTNMVYGGLYYNRYATGSNANTTVRYGIAVQYTGYYGAPATFDDGTSLIPYWYCNMGSQGTKKLQRYVIGGSSNTGTVTYYNEFSLKYFGDISSQTSWQNKNMYPYYPTSDAGSIYIYTEVAKYDDASVTNARNNPNELVPIGNNNFARFKGDNYPTFENFGQDGNIVFKNNEGYRKFLDGYTTYAVKFQDRQGYQNQTVYRDNLPNSGGADYKTIRVYLERNKYIIELSDATLNADSGFATDYLYKQKITALPSESQITGTKGEEFTFDGWYTSSTYDTKIADRRGNILDSYKNSGLALVDSDGDVVMNYQNMQIFAKWAPKVCNLSFNPFFPDLQEDSSQIMQHDPVPYETILTEAPELSLPSGHSNRYFEEVEEEDGSKSLHYIIKKGQGETEQKVGDYKFLGWYTYSGHVAPSGPDDLENEYVFGETPITDDTTLYAKWEKVYAQALYTVTCVDYSSGETIFSVLRSGNENSALTINPPQMGDNEENDVEILIGGTYNVLEDYESLSVAIDTTLKDGDEHKFTYKRKVAWEFIVKNMLNVPDETENGKDILINSTMVSTVYIQHQLAAANLPGYSIYQYQIDNNVPVSKTDASGYIPVLKPSDDTTVPIVICRYRINEGLIKPKAETINYYKYDPVDWVDCALDLGEDNWKEVLFSWADEEYAPAIVYNISNVITSAFIGDETSDAATEAISAIPSGSYSTQMQLVAMKKDGSGSLPIVVNIGTDDEKPVEVSAQVTISDSYDVLKFNGTGTTSGGKIYYKHYGVNEGTWYWDDKLKYEIGRNGVSLIQDITQLPESVRQNAQNVIKIITDNIDPVTGEYKAFFVVVSEGGTLKAYTVVDRLGYLRNGSKLKGEMDVYVEGGTGDNVYTIILYDKNGNEIGEVEVRF